MLYHSRICFYLIKREQLAVCKIHKSIKNITNIRIAVMHFFLRSKTNVQILALNQTIKKFVMKHTMSMINHIFSKCFAIANSNKKN